MRKVLIIPALVISLFFNTIYVKAEEDPSIELIKGFATAYCYGTTTYSGEPVHDGICASSIDRIGKTIIIYKRLPDGKIGDYIGTFECKDTGSTDGIKKGTVIDIWCKDKEKCQEFMNLVYEDGCEGKIWIQIIDAEG